MPPSPSLRHCPLIRTKARRTSGSLCADTTLAEARPAARPLAAPEAARRGAANRRRPAAAGIAWRADEADAEAAVTVMTDIFAQAILVAVSGRDVGRGR